MSKVAVVTGANKGIGYAIAKRLAKEFEGITYLTARNMQLGHESLNKVKEEVGEPNSDKIKFHQLDITDKDSITQLRDHLQNEFNGLDVLVNNAGFAFKMRATEPFGMQAEVTLGTNYYGTKQTCDILFPLLRPHARVVNVCSLAGNVRSYGKDVKERLTSPDLTIEELDEIMNRFIELSKSGTHTGHGFPNTAYGVSKAGEIALTLIQARNLEKDSREDLIINACCPGYVATDMSSHKGHLTPDQGADTPVYLALLSPNCDGPRGKMVTQRKAVDWTN